MAVIGGSDYRAIAVAYSTARQRMLSAKQDFFDAVYLIVTLNQLRPEVDLLISFFDAYNINTELLKATTLFESATRTINQHVISAGGFATVDAYLDDKGITVPQDWADISSASGFTISSGNID